LDKAKAYLKDDWLVLALLEMLLAWSREQMRVIRMAGSSAMMSLAQQSVQLLAELMVEMMEPVLLAQKLELKWAVQWALVMGLLMVLQ
jgi:hypothetical protein